MRVFKIALLAVASFGGLGGRTPPLLGKIVEKKRKKEEKKDKKREKREKKEKKGKKNTFWKTGRLFSLYF